MYYGRQKAKFITSNETHNWLKSQRVAIQGKNMFFPANTLPGKPGHQKAACACWNKMLTAC